MEYKLICEHPLRRPFGWRLYRTEDGKYFYQRLDTNYYELSVERVLRLLRSDSMPLSAYKRVFQNDATAIFFYHFWGG